MDSRPAGPRQPVHQHQTGDKRTAAYESIFGRPSASHHNLGPQPSGLSYSSSVRGSPSPQGNGQQYLYPSQQQHYQSQLDRRTSHASFAPSAHPQAPQQSLYRQSFGQSPSPQQPSQISQQQQYPPHQQNEYGGQPIAPPNAHTRARSLMSSPHAAGVIASYPDEPPDASLEVLTRAGLTPAQAYQAQVYLNSPAGQQSGWNGQGDLPPAVLRPASLPNNAGSSQSTTRSAIDVPTLGINLDPDGGGLGLDFAAGSSPSDPDTDEGSSELPWARSAERRTRGCFLFFYFL
jgi:RHO1 GDP-GTP exchange protein 1/2